LPSTLKLLALISEYGDLRSNSNFTAIENDQAIIITRNYPDFKESKIPVMTEGKFMKSILK